MTDFLKRMNDRLASRGMTGRQDLEMHDAKSVEDGRAVRVLATYSPVYGPPSVHDVQHWLRQRMGEFAEKVQARQDTLLAYPENNFVTFILESKVVRQPLSASADMVRTGVDKYLDAEQNLWEVVTAENGPSFILKRDSTPVEKMLEFRRQALRGGASGRKHITLAAADSIPSAGGGYATADVGDTVDFYANGSIYRGKISSVTANGVKVSTGNDSFTIDPAAITAIVEKSPASQKEQDDVMRRYWSLVYPGNPKMTEAISPTSSKPIKDNRPLEVEPIEKAVAASFSATVKVAKPATSPKKVKALLLVNFNISVTREQLENMGATDPMLLNSAPYTVLRLSDEESTKAASRDLQLPLQYYPEGSLSGVYANDGKIKFVFEANEGKMTLIRGKANRPLVGDELLLQKAIEDAITKGVSAAARPTKRAPNSK